MKRNQITAKPFLIFAMVAVMILSSITVSYGSGFSDVSKTNWAYEAVTFMSDKAIIKGYPNGSFLPNNTVTYGEFIKMALIAGTGEDVGNASKPEHWARNYYNKALELQYFTTADIGQNQLSDSIARGDMALIISSILGNVKIEKYDEIQKGITDVNYQTKHEYDITKSYAAGILTGYPDNTFKPDKTLSRAESAIVIYRLIDESKRELPGEKKDSAYKIVNTADYVDVSTVKNAKASNTGDFTEKAELYKDASGFDMEINKAWTAEWGCSFNHTLNGFIYLVKDKKVVAYCPTTPHYDEKGNFLYSYGSLSSVDVTKVDYILVTRPEGSGDLVKLVPNPFK